MANQFSTTTFVAKAMTEFFVQKSPLLNTANRNYLELFNNNSTYATGGTINIKKPGYQAVTTGLQTTAQDLDDQFVPYTITEADMYSITNALSLVEENFEVVGGKLALTEDSQKAVVDNYVKPIFLALEGRLETEAALRMANTAYITPIDTPEKLGSINSYSDVSQVEELMTELKFAAGERYGVMNAGDAREVADSLQNSFQPTLNQNITKTARIGGPDKGNLAGFDLYRCADIAPHIVGEQMATSATFTVTSVSEDGTQLTLAGVNNVTSRLFKAGDRISIPSVTLLDPITKVDRKWKLVVTVSADANGDGAGNCVVTISEPLLASGMHANVSALPAATAPAELFPSHNLNFFYVPSGLSAVPLPLNDIEGAQNSTTKTKKGNVPVKCVVQGSVNAFTNTFRNTMLCGIKAFAGYIVVLPSAYNG